MKARTSKRFLIERRPMLSLRSILRPTRIVDAHCDIPCGVYDPEQARIEAESCLRIIEKHDASDDKHFRARCIHVKEERAELVKHHLDRSEERRVGKSE